MNKPASKNVSSRQTIFVTISIFISGLCWYLANEIHGHFWYLLWVAPVPILLMSVRVKGTTAFLIAYIAYTIGRLSWFNYLHQVSSLSFAIILTLFLPLLFSLVLIATRKIVLISQSWLSVFALPVLFTASEFIMLNTSPDGSSSSMAYTQMNCLPIIQVASVTGILGITFIAHFIPSAIAVGWQYRFQKKKFFPLVAVSLSLIIVVFLFGMIRLQTTNQGASFKAGLVMLDEQYHDFSKHPDFQKSIQVTSYYAKEISRLADSGAQIILAPERAININTDINNEALSILAMIAKQKQVFIVIGYTNFKKEAERNSVLVINSNGDVVVDYNKVHLISGLENRFVPGNSNSMGLFSFHNVPAGVAICKDLDFPDYIQKYGKQNISFIIVPAWDFELDYWLHSRVSILRSVENGFSMIRTARQGSLTISDCYGRVTNEANGANGKAISLLGSISLQHKDTFYTRFGDWFGMIDFIAAIAFIMFIIIRTKHKTASETA